MPLFTSLAGREPCNQSAQLRLVHQRCGPLYRQPFGLALPTLGPPRLSPADLHREQLDLAGDPALAISAMVTVTANRLSSRFTQHARLLESFDLGGALRLAALWPTLRDRPPLL